jgi:hypothetical protein
MESFTILADKYAQNSLHKVAFSALPDAPVQPYIEPRHRIRHLLARIRRPAHRPVIDLRPARYGPEC